MVSSVASVRPHAAPAFRRMATRDGRLVGLPRRAGPVRASSEESHLASRGPAARSPAAGDAVGFGPRFGNESVGVVVWQPYARGGPRAHGPQREEWHAARVSGCTPRHREDVPPWMGVRGMRLWDLQPTWLKRLRLFLAIVWREQPGEGRLPARIAWEVARAFYGPHRGRR